ncbi:hypothetical protein ACLESD_10160 [Pyxidicoccus sp. 3LFB2]
MFNFLANSDAVMSTPASGMDEGTPSVKALFGDWWVLAQPE